MTFWCKLEEYVYSRVIASRLQFVRDFLLQTCKKSAHDTINARLQAVRVALI